MHKIVFDIENSTVTIGSKVFEYYNTDNSLYCHSRCIQVVGTESYYNPMIDDENKENFYEYIKDIDIKDIPNNMSFDIYNYNYKDIEKPLDTVIFPFTMVEFLKKDNKFYVVFGRYIDEDNWTSEWTVDFYFNKLRTVCNNFQNIDLVSEHHSCKFKDEVKWLFVEFIENSLNTIEIAFKYALQKLSTLCIETQVALYGGNGYTELINDWEANINNNNEKYWQNLFHQYSWILEQCFATPHLIFQSQAYLGGADIRNKNGRIIDYMYINQMSNNVSLIEIKTPTTKLLSREYRNTYSIATELTGSINQLLNYKDIFIKHYYYNISNSDSRYDVFNPKSFLIVGNYSTLDGKQKSCFELFRNELRSVEIITYDELLMRVKNMFKLFKKQNIY